MAATTKRILLISTMHVLYGPLHPLHIAKYGATLDHIAKGRWGINVVIGHRAIEHEMPGWQRSEHDKRYAMAGELFDITNSLWGGDGNITYQGKVNPWSLVNAWITPKPLYSRLIVANAAGSPAGSEFAARYSDLVFVTSPGGAHIDSALETLSDHIKNIKAAAQAVGRDVKIIINPMIVSRDTLEELEGYALILWKASSNKQRGRSLVRSKELMIAMLTLGAWRGRKDTSHKQGCNLGGNIEVTTK
ncbi:putative Luciferase-like domain-containing protein [Seiridium unicorne]|uniref:Luciferase-like domain-containing protein n=1 Tax=Seiridium unicorne TaxID=138068 RepID=A0ABR2VH20_9PEZI